MSTFTRYKAALEEVAAGVSDPQRVAMEALRSRRPEKKASNPNRRTLEEIIQAGWVRRWAVLRAKAEGKSHKEIAMECDISYQSVRIFLHQAVREALRSDYCGPLREIALKVDEEQRRSGRGRHW